MKLTYGNGATCELPGVDVTWARANSEATVVAQDVSTAVKRAFADPLDYPGLASATVPGDTVAIAVEYQTPQLAPVVAGTLAALEHAGVDSSAITILLSSEFAADAARQQTIRNIAGDEVRLVVHEADMDDHLALLGVTEANRPLRLNRVLCEADLVIPIGVTRSTPHDDESATFPSFSDQATRSRFHAPGAHETSRARENLAAEVRECHWMLGVNLALQIVPGPGSSIAAVYCGTPPTIAAAARATYDHVWSAAVDRRADLIVATIVGDETQQTWQNLSWALAIAEDLVAPGGAIAVCSDIAQRPGASGRRLRDAADLAETERKLLKDEFPDSVAALQLCRSLQRGPIYLKSRLDSELVERLGLAPIHTNDELARLVQTYHHCLVLEEAQHLQPKLTG